MLIVGLVYRAPVISANESNHQANPARVQAYSLHVEQKRFPSLFLSLHLCPSVYGSL